MNAYLTSLGPFFASLVRVSAEAAVLIVLVAVAQRLFRNQLAPKWRYALWFLVVLRLALPWSFQSPISIFNLFSPKPAIASASGAEPATALTGLTDEGQPDSAKIARPPAAANAAVRTSFISYNLWPGWLVWAWLAGVVLMPAGLLFDNCRMQLRIRRQRPLIDEGVLSLLEDCKQEMQVYTPLTLIETDAVASPSLYGFIRPRLLLPQGFTRSFSRAELRYVFLHELAHVRRRDIPSNWLMTLLLTLHWFNPFVWYTFSRMQTDRELACDALALSQGEEQEKQSYGFTIIKLLEHFSRPARLPSMVGILEDKNQMKRRITMIAEFKKSNRWPVTASLLFVALAALCLTDACSPKGAGVKAGDAESGSDTNATAEAAPVEKTGPPEIVATSPETGATDVDPALTEITVTFNRDMGEGFSWTGSGPNYPTGPEGQRAHWRDKRTCVLPVRLARGHLYRVGINSMSFHGFSSASGAPVTPSEIYFTTQGASAQLKRLVSTPKIVGLEPKNGAQDVEPESDRDSSHV